MMEYGKPTSEMGDTHAALTSLGLHQIHEEQTEITAPPSVGDVTHYAADTAVGATVTASVMDHHRASNERGEALGSHAGDAASTDIETADELPSAGGAEPPIETPPTRRMEAGGDRPDPTLEPGEVLHGSTEDALMGDGPDAIIDGMDDADYDPQRPDKSYVRAGNFAIGRAGGEYPDLTFEGRSEGCRIVTLSNSRGEGTLLHVDVGDMGTIAGEEAIEVITTAIPSLAHPETIARIFGDVETSPLGQAAADWNERLAAYIREQGITDVKIITRGRGKDVVLQLRTGEVQATDLTGAVIYPLPSPEDAA